MKKYGKIFSISCLLLIFIPPLTAQKEFSYQFAHVVCHDRPFTCTKGNPQNMVRKILFFSHKYSTVEIVYLWECKDTNTQIIPCSTFKTHIYKK